MLIMMVCRAVVVPHPLAWGVGRGAWGVPVLFGAWGATLSPPGERGWSQPLSFAPSKMETPRELPARVCRDESE